MTENENTEISPIERQKLASELAELVSDNIKQNGQPRKDAVPQEIKRIEELKKMLDTETRTQETEHKTQNAGSGAVENNTGGGETAEQKVKRLEKENKALKSVAARGRDAAKIKSAEKKVGYVPRPDEIMAEALDDAEQRDPKNWDESNKLAVERTIRRFVRKGGSRKDHKGDFYDIPAGFKKGITFEEKEYALKLLEMLGRLRGGKGAAEDILKMIADRETMPVSKQRQTAKEFNIKLETLGVAWDDSIQVPGMSMTLRS